MSNSIVKLIVVSVVASAFPLLARGDWGSNFEPPDYSLGSLEGQQGWTAPFGPPTASVVSTPGFFPAAAGSQVIQHGGDAPMHTTTGIGLTDISHFSGLLGIDGSPTGTVEFDWFRDQPSTVPGFEIGGLGGWQFTSARPQHLFVRSGNGHVSSPFITGPIAVEVDTTIDFTNQQFHSIFTDVTSGGSGGVLWDAGWQPFSNPTTLAQANNNSQLWLNVGGSAIDFFQDNIKFAGVPEPSALALLLTGIVGVLAFARRRPKHPNHILGRLK